MTTTDTIAIHVRLAATTAVGASRLARWRGESLSGYVARLVRKDVESQRHTLAALEALEGPAEAEEGSAS